MLNAITRGLCPEEFERQLRARGEDPWELLQEFQERFLARSGAKDQPGSQKKGSVRGPKPTEPKSSKMFSFRKIAA
jgi:hypothetical protein